MKDISDMKEALGDIIARYTYDSKPESILMETDIVIRFELAMLDGLDKLDVVADNDGNTYRELFRRIRSEWMKAVSLYNPKSGEWKEMWKTCSLLLDTLMRIAIKEELINISEVRYDMEGEGFNLIGRLARAIRNWFIVKRLPG